MVLDCCHDPPSFHLDGHALSLPCYPSVRPSARLDPSLHSAALDPWMGRLEQVVTGRVARPLTLDFFFAPSMPRVPRPCVFCKGGYDAALCNVISLYSVVSSRRGRVGKGNDGWPAIWFRDRAPYLRRRRHPRTRPCPERKDGAPTVSVVQTVSKRGPPA